MNIFYA